MNPVAVGTTCNIEFSGDVTMHVIFTDGSHIHIIGYDSNLAYAPMSRMFTKREVLNIQRKLDLEKVAHRRFRPWLWFKPL
jgi:hypothetical protein